MYACQLHATHHPADQPGRSSPVEPPTSQPTEAHFKVLPGASEAHRRHTVAQLAHPAPGLSSTAARLSSTRSTRPLRRRRLPAQYRSPTTRDRSQASVESSLVQNVGSMVKRTDLRYQRCRLPELRCEVASGGNTGAGGETGACAASWDRGAAFSVLSMASSVLRPPRSLREARALYMPEPPMRGCRADPVGRAPGDRGGRIPPQDALSRRDRTGPSCRPQR